MTRDALASLAEAVIADTEGDGYDLDDDRGTSRAYADLCERLEWEGYAGTEIERYDLAEDLIENLLAKRPPAARSAARGPARREGE